MDRSLKLLQWNLGNADVRLRLPGRGVHGQPYTNASPSRDEDLADLAAVIRHEAPDLVTVQELDLRRGHQGLLGELLPEYRFDALGALVYHNARHVQAVLVRRALEKSERVLPPWSGFQGVGVCVRPFGDALELGVVSNHSTPGGKRTEDRIAQHRSLAGWAREAARELPLVVGGDFNFDPEVGGMLHRAHRASRLLPLVGQLVSKDWQGDCAAMQEIAEVLKDFGRDSGRTAGPPRRWKHILLPVGAPVLPLAWALGVGRMRSRIDYVFGCPRVHSTEVRVLRLTGGRAEGHPAVRRGAFEWMDHDPVVVQFRIDEEEAQP